MPSLAAANCQQAVNQTVRDARVLESAVTEPPAALTALRADESRRPAQPLQIVQAVRVGGEPGAPATTPTSPTSSGPFSPPLDQATKSGGKPGIRDFADALQR